MVRCDLTERRVADECVIIRRHLAPQQAHTAHTHTHTTQCSYRICVLSHRHPLPMNKNIAVDERSNRLVFAIDFPFLSHIPIWHWLLPAPSMHLHSISLLLVLVVGRIRCDAATLVETNTKNTFHFSTFDWLDDMRHWRKETHTHTRASEECSRTQF